MNNFIKLVEEILEENSNSTSGVGVGSTGNQFSGDTYATGDARIPKILGMTKRTFPPMLTFKNKKSKNKTKSKHKSSVKK